MTKIIACKAFTELILELVKVHVDRVKASTCHQELEKNVETLYSLIESTINSLDSSTVHEFSADIISSIVHKTETLVDTLIPTLLEVVFPSTPASTYLQFSCTMKGIVWACQLDLFDFSEILIKFCISYIKVNPFIYSPLFKILSDLIGVNSEHQSIKDFINSDFAQDFVKLGNILGSQEDNFAKFCESLPQLLNLLATLLLFNPVQTLAKSEDFLLLTQNLAKVYQRFNNAETKSAILTFWTTCLSIEGLYRNNDNLQVSLALIMATPLACVRNLPSMSLTHQITKVYTSGLLRPFGRRQQLQTPREMERERNTIESGVRLGANQVRDLMDKDRNIICSRLLGCKDVANVYDRSEA